MLTSGFHWQGFQLKELVSTQDCQHPTRQHSSNRYASHMQHSKYLSTKAHMQQLHMEHLWGVKGPL